MLVAAIQLTSKNDKKKNLSVAQALMERGVRQGAKLICLPEYFSFIGSRSELIAQAEKDEKGPAFQMVQSFAKKHGVFVLATIPIHPPKSSVGAEKGKLLNRSYLLDPEGKTLAKYDKIHLFDTELLESRAFQESHTFTPGAKAQVVEAPFGKVGFSICFDLRFPELYRALTLLGARIVFVPSAFTMYTGKDHWLPLLKARAIENQIYIVAPAQYGKHAEHKISFGKSCIIDPWGNVIALAPDCETVIVADVDFKFLTKVRKELPLLKHIRKDLFSL